MGLGFFSTLAGISAEILALVMAFYGAYLVYLRQQRDKYREELVRDFQELDRTISRWSVLEEYTHPPGWHPPIGRYLQILQKESWEKTPLETLQDSLEELDRIYKEAWQKEMELRAETKDKIPALPALYNETKFTLHNLVLLIYAAFPRPPGEYEVSPPPGEIPHSVKSFVRADFPDNREAFIPWARRFDVFFEDLYKTYYRILPIIDTFKNVHRESIEQTNKLIVELEKMGRLDQLMKNTLRESQEHLAAEVKYYEQVFQFLVEMKHRIDQIRDKVSTYDNYAYKETGKTAFSFISMVLTGVLIPFTILFSEPTFPLKTMNFIQLLSGLGFGLSTFSAVFLIYQDISKF